MNSYKTLELCFKKKKFNYDRCYINSLDNDMTFADIAK